MPQTNDAAPHLFPLANVEQLVTVANLALSQNDPQKLSTGLFINGFARWVR